MSESIQPSWFRKLNYTPWRDLLRGRLTGRMDVKSQIAAADLSPAIQALLHRIVKRTRLWPLEKVDVANELMSHFADGIESGKTIEQLIEAFGNERAAAKLIRRAKVRNRPTIWHIKRAMVYSFIVVFVLYVGLLLRMFTSHPTVKINYVNEINSRFDRIPLQQRAWPIYRQAILLYNDHPTEGEASRQWDKMINSQPGSKHWPAMVQWLESHQRILELIREGSEKPALGFVLGREGSANDPQLWANTTDYSDSGLGKDWLISLPIPHLNYLRSLGNILRADIQRAREQHDNQQLVGDLTALWRMGAQTTESNDFLVTALVGIGIRTLALDELDRTLANTPELISDSDLQSLAHLMTAPQQVNQLLSVRGEREFFYDMAQRIYTDDGNGNGRLTRDGVRLLVLAAGTGGAEHAEAAGLAAGPLLASRRDMIELYDHFINKAEANFSKPIRDADWQGWEKEFMAWRQPLVNRIRFAPIAAFMPSLERAEAVAERCLGERDGLLAALALEAFHRKHGNYPDSLGVLVPELLPTVPIDRMTGQPLRYKLVDGHPLIYSCGADKDDDGGRPPVDKRGVIQNFSSADFLSSSKSVPDGDWILYPQPRNPYDDEDDAEE